MWDKRIKYNESIHQVEISGLIKSHLNIREHLMENGIVTLLPEKCVNNNQLN